MRGPENHFWIGVAKVCRIISGCDCDYLTEGRAGAEYTPTSKGAPKMSLLQLRVGVLILCLVLLGFTARGQGATMNDSGGDIPEALDSCRG